MSLVYDNSLKCVDNISFYVWAVKIKNENIPNNASTYN